MYYQPILSKDNVKIKELYKLISQRGYRYEKCLAVVYGEHLVEEARKYHLLKSVFINQDKLKDYNKLLTNLTKDQVFIVTKLLLAKLQLAESVPDIVGVISLNQLELEPDIYNKDCLILENIQDPGNLGTLLRASRACGIKNIILSKGCVDPYNIKTIRASQGIQFGLNIYPDINLSDFIKNYQGQVLATVPRAKESVYTRSLTNATAWVFGNEGAGLTDDLLNQVSNHLSIPMVNDTESLNVAMSATVCLFEMLRQRLASETVSF